MTKTSEVLFMKARKLWSFNAERKGEFEKESRGR